MFSQLRLQSRFSGLNRRYKRFILILLAALAFLTLLRIRSPSERAADTTRSITNDLHLLKNLEHLTDEEIYRNKYGRDAPPNYSKWIEYAKSQSCSVDLDDYERINLDLAPFRQTPITEKMIQKGLKLSRMISITIKNGQLGQPKHHSW
jgi:hypothetical protein